jgi:phosphoglycolate phosphatase
LILEKKKLIIFDLDGTLIDSGADLTLALNSMLKKLNRQTFSEKLVHSWLGNGAKTLVKRALSGGVEINENLEDSLFEKALQIFLQTYKENVCIKTSLYPDVIETLQLLEKQNKTMAIVTNKPFEFVAPILKTLNIDRYFKVVLGGDTLKEKKPSPLPLLYLCEKLQISQIEALMVGDSKNDILSAKSAKIESIGVTYGYNYGEDISLYKPDFIIDNLSKMMEI